VPPTGATRPRPATAPDAGKPSTTLNGVWPPQASTPALNGV
jgi:hypothetical protein